MHAGVPVCTRVCVCMCVCVCVCVHSPHLCAERYLGVVFTGVVLSNGNLVRTWAGLLLSATVRMQVATLGGFKASFIIRHMQAAVRQARARPSHNHVPSERWVRFTSSHCRKPKSLSYYTGGCKPMPSGRQGATHPGTSAMLTTSATLICVVHGATMLVVFCRAVGPENLFGV